jgi:hypothetical protein
MPNAAHMETTNNPGQGSKTCAEDKGNIQLEKGGPRRTREAEEERAILRLTPAKWTGGQPKGKVPDQKLGTSKTEYCLKEIAKNGGKKQKKEKTKTTKNKNKTNAKNKQNKWARVIPWEMGPHFPEKLRLGLGLGGCANHQPFPENLCAH